jgi:hypothetical protein
MSTEFEQKSPLDVLFDLPQERVTALTRGYGPRRGNLERLLRYWRPIMKKPGGFTRCRVILANHPNLYPLERICAWLHHETTGLWPNEGCHHPGMKNCKGKLKKNNMTDVAFRKKLKKLGRAAKPNKKDGFPEDVFDYFYSDIDHPETNDGNPVVTEEDVIYAMKVLSEFCEMEKGFADFLRNEQNWEIEGEDENGNVKSLPFSSVNRKSLEDECCG